MKVILAPRGSGKTGQLIQLAARDFLYIVCRDHHTAREIHLRAAALGYDIPFPLTYDEFRKGAFYGRGIRGFLVDDVDDLVRALAGGVPVVAITLTKEEP